MPAFGSMLRWSLCAMGTLSFLVSFLMLNVLENKYPGFPLQHRLASHDNATRTSTIRVGRNRTISITRKATNEWPMPFVHIINTRFMQHQADLVDLARARLVLFETFCLKSIVGQSLLARKHVLPPVLWIIKTDPNLDESLVKELVALIKPYPFIYLVASNVNYGIGVIPGGFRGAEAGQDVLQSHVYSGNMTLFRQAYAARESRAVLETRLDADDGLHVHVLEAIQAEARVRLRFSSKQRGRQEWMYWCCQNHLDWSPSPPFAINASDYGTFVPYRSRKSCITAGITLGVSVGQDEKTVPRFMHHQLYQELSVNKTRATCGNDTCLRMVDKPVLAAIRSRTATSAGMRNVKLVDEEEPSEHAVPIRDNHLINALHKGFHVFIKDVVKVNRHMQEHVLEIVEDNLRGQCMRGHSCKNSTREALEELLRVSKSNNSAYQQQ